jgi:hypothetical protein
MIDFTSTFELLLLETNICFSFFWAGTFISYFWGRGPGGAAADEKWGSAYLHWFNMLRPIFTIENAE